MNKNSEQVLNNLQLATGLDKSVLTLHDAHAVSDEMLNLGIPIDLVTGRLEYFLAAAGELKLTQGIDVLGNGFKITLDSANGEVSLRKHLLIKDMPYASEHMVDSEVGISENTKVIVEITAQGRLTLDMPEVGYGEEYAHFIEEDAVSLLKDTLQ